MRKRWFYWLLTILWMIVIYYFSAVPNSNEVTQSYFGGFNYWVRKAAHVSEYAILFAISRLAVDKRLPLAWLVTIGYAITDEWHQCFVPGRTGTPLDVCIDSIGPLLISIGLSFARPQGKTIDRESCAGGDTVAGSDNI